MAAQELTQWLGHGEGEHEMMRGQLPFELSCEPRIGLSLLAGRTVAVAAAPRHDMLLLAALALIEQGPAGLGAAADDGLDHLLLGVGHRGTEALDVSRPMGAEDLLERAHARDPPSHCRSAHRRPREPCA